MTTVNLGKWNKLKINRFTDHGAYLDGGEMGEILMPKQYVQPTNSIDDEVEVFVYLDQGERLVATKESPLAEVNQFAYLTVSWVNQFGAFLHWGVMKDLFVPFCEQKQKMEIGKSYLVYISIDTETGRIIGTAKIEKYLNLSSCNYNKEQPVNILIWKKTPLGYKVIIEQTHEGLIYDNQIFTPIHIGDKLTAFITQIREDGKIDLSLQPVGKANVVLLAQKIEALLHHHQGFLPFTDKSSSHEIYQTFQASKKTFKKAIGALYKQKKIILSQDGIRLNLNK